MNAVDTSFVLAATAAGPLGGLAAVAGVDAVKGVIAAGKRSRGDTKTKGDHFRVSDVLRGVVHAAKEAADEGAALRGKREGSGNILDWAGMYPSLFFSSNIFCIFTHLSYFSTDLQLAQQPAPPITRRKTSRG